MLRYTIMPFAIVLLAASPSLSQQTTVQLPTFGFTTVNTNVSVPDGGTAQLGGILRAAEGRTERGVPILGKVPFVNRLFKNNAIGRNVSSMQQVVTPRIIILEEEEAKLGVEIERRTAARFDPEAARIANAANFLNQHIARNSPATDMRTREPRRQPVEDALVIRKNPEEIRRERDAEAITFFQKAVAAEAQGKSGVAKVYYGMVARRSQGDLQAEALARLAGLGAQSGASRVATSP